MAWVYEQLYATWNLGGGWGKIPGRHSETFAMGATTESESMLRLAAEAFRAKDYDLAADIYECQLQGAPPCRRLELMVKLADALAFGGKLTEALGVYRQASELERLGPEHLEKLLEYLTESVRRKEGPGRCRRIRGGEARADSEAPAAGRPAAGASLSDSTSGGSPSPCAADFSCRICLSFLYEPVTLTCGHCFCKKCLEREKRSGPAAGCRECGRSSALRTPDVADGQYRVNVVLSNLLAKWFPLHSHAVRLRREGNGLYADGKMEAALEKYNQAISIAPRDHILFSNRSQIHCSLRHYDQALRDAETTCTLMPQWSKGHVRKAQALVSMGRSEEALREYLISLSIEPSRLARSEAYKLLSDLLAPLTDHVPERILDYSSLLSSRMHIKSNMATHTASSLYTAASLKSSHSLNTSKPSTESNLLASPPVLKHPPCLCERSGTEEVRGQSEARGGRPEAGFLPKRKIGIEEEDGAEKHDSCKRSKLESSEVCGSLGSVVTDIIDPTDLECSLCMRLFYEPVTTPCGHTFCLQCLERCLDHKPKCPLCKQELSEYLAERQFFKTVLMENLIAKYVPSEMMDRKKVNLEELAELSNLNKNVPIFVCTMAFPTVPCPLHVFEPCYRLMIRRCMETGTKCFGMCLGDDLKGKISPRFASYGCLLEIRDVEFFSDGRSVVDTIGRRRFKVLQHHQRDGYNTADIEYLEDIKVEGVAEKELQSLHDAVYDQAMIWVNSLKKEQKERIIGHFGPMPEKDPEPQTSPNGPSWCWWLLAVLPLEGRAQLPFLALTSLKERLCGIRRVLLFMACSKHR